MWITYVTVTGILQINVMNMLTLNCLFDYKPQACNIPKIYLNSLIMCIWKSIIRNGKKSFLAFTNRIYYPLDVHRDMQRHLGPQTVLFLSAAFCGFIDGSRFLVYKILIVKSVGILCLLGSRIPHISDVQRLHIKMKRVIKIR
jgi:hypothetical protein